MCPGPQLHRRRHVQERRPLAALTHGAIWGTAAGPRPPVLHALQDREISSHGLVEARVEGENIRQQLHLVRAKVLDMAGGQQAWVAAQVDKLRQPLARCVPEELPAGDRKEGPPARQHAHALVAPQVLVHNVDDVLVPHAKPSVASLQAELCGTNGVLCVVRRSHATNFVEHHAPVKPARLPVAPGLLDGAVARRREQLAGPQRVALAPEAEDVVEDQDVP
mmetsp:Transcript_72622/g.234767  ORF Transcript_72622/g.234767 Transcript_72622/m.234767 type:complete len:221 (+) Transcript_72622:284-946(+)